MVQVEMQNDLFIHFTLDTAILALFERVIIMD